ncbi:hypothetical protein BN381_130147 [Candidatus Microthrix parvicella RN1]|uniref:Uncharacterized protein n=1 Tax=Candidatus Neomicrothrix parvicella RN1 TaxID=1229780 RepID=R4YWJ7_9ACTN|nr:hypothetical protein BN381_130147 [Candidatus Microthrix parvicella RN1]
MLPPPPASAGQVLTTCPVLPPEGVDSGSDLREGPVDEQNRWCFTFDPRVGSGSDCGSLSGSSGSRHATGSRRPP